MPIVTPIMTSRLKIIPPPFNLPWRNLAMHARNWFVVAASVALLATSLYAADAIKLDGIKCPVAGTKAAKAGTEVDYKGGKVFFCCDNCPKAFAADKAKFAEKANHQLAATKQAKQVKCP